ncbi:MAG: hypothetical protein AB1758_19765 [Candidatus Eremiobacterota bacterium]
MPEIHYTGANARELRQLTEQTRLVFDCVELWGSLASRDGSPEDRDPRPGHVAVNQGVTSTVMEFDPATGELSRLHVVQGDAERPSTEVRFERGENGAAEFTQRKAGDVTRAFSIDPKTGVITDLTPDPRSILVELDDPPWEPAILVDFGEERGVQPAAGEPIARVVTADPDPNALSVTDDNGQVLFKIRTV